MMWMSLGKCNLQALERKEKMKLIKILMKYVLMLENVWIMSIDGL